MPPNDTNILNVNNDVSIANEAAAEIEKPVETKNIRLEGLPGKHTFGPSVPDIPSVFDRPMKPAFKSTREMLIVDDIADALHTSFPTSVDSTYLLTVERAASYVGNPSRIPATERQGAKRHTITHGLPITYGSINVNTSSTYYGLDLKKGTNQNQAESIRNSVAAARNNVFDVVNRVNSFIAKAKALGFDPPDNPFSVITGFNAGRVGFSAIGSGVNTPAIASALVFNIGAYVDLLRAEREGKLNLESQSAVAQLSSVRISVQGFGGSGNAALDVMSFLNNVDILKEQKFNEEINRFNFKAQAPKISYVANYHPGDAPVGCIIGWKKITEASGYVITRRNIFDESKSISYRISNADLRDRYPQIKEYVDMWVLPFYPDANPNNMLGFLDTTVSGHNYYTYSIRAYQMQNLSKSIFSFPRSIRNANSEQRARMRAEIEAVDPGTGPDSVSPYPILAKYMLGSEQYDWILAGINIDESMNRGDNLTNTRKFSYLTAQLDFIFSQMDEGKFVVPDNVTEIIKNLENKIFELGVLQIVDEIVKGTGVLFFFEGKDISQDVIFDRVGDDKITALQAVSRNSEGQSIFHIILSSIDLETATMDTRVLAANMPKLFDGSIFGAAAYSKELDYPQSFDNSENNLKIERVDLTTVDGISKFMKAIRVVSDFGTLHAYPVENELSILTPADQPPNAPIRSPKIHTSVSPGIAAAITAKETSVDSTSSPEKTPTQPTVDPARLLSLIKRR